MPAPVGTWKILGATVWPWFRYDEGMLNYGVRTENYYNLPPGPNNLVGILWMGLNKPGIGIHGTNNPETIGRAASHGCIRLANWDAARVKDLVSVGNTVHHFLNSSPSSRAALTLEGLHAKSPVRISGSGSARYR